MQKIQIVTCALRRINSLLTSRLFRVTYIYHRVLCPSLLDGTPLTSLVEIFFEKTNDINRLYYFIKRCL
jgi:hypothetical protein